MYQSPAPRPADRRNSRLAEGFSLIELLVVLLILTVVIAIVVPTLQAFRNSARKAVTTDIMAQLSAVASQFKIDKNRLPGYFSTKDMGDTTNVTGGNANAFTGMENMMLDLAGGITTTAANAGNNNPCDPVGGPPVITVGPTMTARVNVDLGRIGAAGSSTPGEAGRVYFKPDPKFFVRQCGTGQRAHVADQLKSAMPVLVDAWGSPILAWVQDDLPPTGFPLAANDSGTRARFYRSSNAAFINATSLGKLIRNQATDSLLGGPSSTANVGSLIGMLSNPGFPGQSRAPVVFHSAGANGVYLGKEERGGKANSGNMTLPAPTGKDYFQEGDFDDFVIKAE